MNGQPLARARVRDAIIELIVGDITDQDTDVIVNAANASLLGGGGVDGAIHRVAGPELLAEARQLGGCRTGDARITRGYNLRARHVVHAVGPVYRRRDPDVAALLASAYRRSLEVAAENGARTIAFPAISTGIYGYPMEEAAPIALRTVADFLNQQTQITLARFVLFDETAYQTFVDALARLMDLEVTIPASGGTPTRRGRSSRRSVSPD